MNNHKNPFFLKKIHIFQRKIANKMSLRSKIYTTDDGNNSEGFGIKKIPKFSYSNSLL